MIFNTSHNCDVTSSTRIAPVVFASRLFITRWEILGLWFLWQRVWLKLNAFFKPLQEFDCDIFWLSYGPKFQKHVMLIHPNHDYHFMLILQIRFNILSFQPKTHGTSRTHEAGGSFRRRSEGCSARKSQWITRWMGVVGSKKPWHDNPHERN